MMKAAQVEDFGEPLRVTDAPDPTAGPGELTVDLTYAGVNPLDLRLCAGGAGRVPLPFVPGCDGAGHVDGVPVVVYGSGIGIQRHGTYATRVTAPPESVVQVPDGLDQEQAAALGMAGVTAWGVVHQSGQMTPDDRVLVLGASGGVGTLVVQLAREVGSQVWAQVADPADAGTVQDLRPEQVAVVAEPGDLRAAVGALKPTVVVDALAGGFTGAALQLMPPRGRIVVYGASAGPRAELDLGALYRKAVTVRGHAALLMPADEASRALGACLEFAANGRLRAHVDSVHPLEEVNEAHRRITARRATGKILLRLAE
jgi:NADPH2:quinone reductase